MAGIERLDRMYAELLKQHEGWALYNKVGPDDLRPGSFGYFDSDGVWKPIAHLLDGGLTVTGWTGLEKHVDKKQNSGRIVWDPKCSSHVRSLDLGGELGLPAPPGSGLEVSATFKIEGNCERGAVLFTEAPITHELVTDDKPLLQWLAQNSKKILQDYGRQIKDHGMWIVTKTYATRSCVISVLQSKSSTITIGLGMDVSGVLTLTPRAKWSSSGGDVSTIMYEDDDGVIVFMCGIFVTKHVWSESLKVQDRREKQQLLRGGEPDELFTIRTTDVDGSEVLLVIERF